MKKIAFLFPLGLLVFLYVYFFSEKTLEFYKELPKLTKRYPVSEWVDSIRPNDSLLIFSKPSNPYRFEYELNLGVYDSVFYFGDYPTLEQVKHCKPDVYDAYRKFYNNLFCQINVIMNL